MADKASPLPVFVAGPARSGTTLLTLTLSSHPAVCLAPENRFIPFLLQQTQGRGALEGEQLEAFRDRVRRDGKLHALKIDIAPYLAHVEQYERVGVRKVVLDYLTYYRDCVSPDAICVGQKKNFLEIWQALKNALPEARLVTIFRDPRAAAGSAARNLPGKTLVSASQRWAQRAREADAFRARFPEDYLELHYESFVAEPEPECRRMCEFLGIPFDEDMLAHHKENIGHERVLKGHEGKHARTVQPINPERVASWRQELTRFQCDIVEAIAGREMEKRGYATDSFGALGPMRRAAVRGRIYLDTGRLGTTIRGLRRHKRAHFNGHD